MKILAFVDVHSDELAIDALIEMAKAAKPDVLVCAGDLSEFGQQLDKLVAKFKILKIPFLMVPGNHELPSEIAALEKKFRFVKNLHLKTFEKGKVLFMGCGGGGFSPFHTPFEKSEKRFAAELNRFKDRRKGVKIVLVTHAPPHNTALDEIDHDHVGVRPLKKFIQNFQPNLVICGHLHETAGKIDKVRKTTIVNPGTHGMLLEI